MIEGIDESHFGIVLNVNSKRKKLSGDERLHRNRERNRMHARKRRQRKKQQSNTLQVRIFELQEEGKMLRQIVDELGLSQTFQDPSAEDNLFKNAPTTTPTALKRIRRRGKYTPQEREKIRRERNKINAKRTRDRKKQLLEVSETMIGKMDCEAKSLRDYLVKLRLLSIEDATKSDMRANESKKELVALKASQNEYDMDGDDYDDEDHFNDDNGDGDDELNNDGSLSGSNDNEKGSNNGSDSLSDSLNGDTSGDCTASTKSNDSSHSAQSSSAFTHSDSSGSISGSGSESPILKHSNIPITLPVLKHATMSFSKEEEERSFYNVTSSTLSKPSAQIASKIMLLRANGVVVAPRAAGSKKSQSVGSYNHGGVVAANEEAKAVEKATYLVYSLQQAEDKLLQASTSSSHSTSKSSPVSIPPTTILQNMNSVPKNRVPNVPNILLSVMPQGISIPKESGEISPRCTFSPLKQGNLLNTLFRDSTSDNVAALQQCRYFPPSNYSEEYFPL